MEEKIVRKVLGDTDIARLLELREALWEGSHIKWTESQEDKAAFALELLLDIGVPDWKTRAKQ